MIKLFSSGFNIPLFTYEWFHALSSWVGKALSVLYITNTAGISLVSRFFFFFVGAKRPPGDKAIQVLRPVNEVDKHQLPVHDHI